jgi:hypothetical protein
MESRTSPGPANLQHHEAVTACLRRAGFSVEMAVHANWLLDSYVYGFVLQEVSLRFDSVDEFADLAVDVYLPQLPPDQYPYLNEAAATLAAAGYDPADEFTFGIDLILDAMEGLRTTPSTLCASSSRARRRGTVTWSAKVPTPQPTTASPTGPSSSPSRHSLGA